LSKISLYMDSGVLDQVKALAAIQQISVSELLSKLAADEVERNKAAIEAYNEQIKAIQSKLK
jgi:hypothetical protein